MKFFSLTQQETIGVRVPINLEVFSSLTFVLCSYRGAACLPSRPSGVLRLVVVVFLFDNQTEVRILVLFSSIFPLVYHIVENVKTLCFLCGF